MCPEKKDKVLTQMMITRREIARGGFADYIANGLFSESFGLPEMCWRAPVHLDIFHVIILCETHLLFNKLYLQIYYRFVIQI